MEDVKANIVKNLILLRKANKLTQQDVADIVNYTDKAVSRWEQGESLPDISILCKLCEYYNVDFEWLIHEHEEAPKISKLASNRIKIAVLSLFVISCYMLATFVFVYDVLVNKATVGFWVAFVWATPLAFIIAGICSKKWWGKFWTTVSISGFLWTFIASVYLQMVYSGLGHQWALFILGAPIQAIIVLLWYIRQGVK